MEEFLRTVARHYLAKVEQQAQSLHQPSTFPFSRYLFCFPNRRSGLFFSRYLQEEHQLAHPGENGKKTPCCVPEMTTIDDLYTHFSSRHVIDRTALLFRLFQVYDKLSKRRERETFDQFVFWGDMLLSDFDDVDKYLVNADQLFANVRDLKEIDAKFSGLTPEQIAVIRSFWHNFRPDVEYPEDDKHEVFGQTWSILADLYHAFREKLTSNNEAYSGMMEREVVESICSVEEGDPFTALPYEKVVFVGLTAVSGVDRKLMSQLRVHGRADFCWDYADPRLQPKDSKATSAAYFTTRNLSDFPNEISETELQRGIVEEPKREVTLYSVASGVGQTRKAGEILQQWMKEGGETFDPFRTAVVLPDETLLLPMLYAVPRSLDKFNVTMGYGLKDTPVAAFVANLIALQQSYRTAEQTFYFRQVLPILSHPFTLMMCKAAARTLTDKIVRGNIYQVPVSLLAANKFLSAVFRPVATADDALTYLAEVLDRLMRHTEDDVDYEFLYHYHKTVSALALEVRSNAIQFTPKTLFMLLEKLVAGVSVPFQGEPLSGLQVMGVLETRSLDFDNIIILSMNEGVFPAKPSQNTFVPMSLRDAFGLPTQRHRDSVFAYHFYRLIGRASRVAMIYDSRSEGMQSGEESRYVKQLRFLMGHKDLLPVAVSDDIGSVQSAEIIVKKTPDILEQLNRCVGDGGDLNFSASVLKNYIQCPLKFYLSFLRQLQEDDEVTEEIDSAIFGDVLHQAMCDIYKPYENRQVQASALQEIIKHPDLHVRPHVEKAFHDICHIDQLAGYNLLVSGLIIDYIVETLRHDVGNCPFIYYNGEGRHKFLFQASDELRVRIKCIYDRLDSPLKCNGTIRIVDYKTGNSYKGGKLVFPSVEDLFSPDGKGSSEAFQVMMYCLMLESASPETLSSLNLAEAPRHVSPHLYFVRDFRSKESVKTSLQIGSGKDAVAIDDFSQYRDAFRTHLSALFAEIFNPEIPFTQCVDTHPCSYCAFANLCNRNIK